MRISDWSSDVCSSDLVQLRQIANSGQSVRKAQPAKLSAEPALVRQRDQILDWLHSCEISGARASIIPGRSEEHTSELQSLMRISYAVFCLIKKKKHKKKHIQKQQHI